MNYSKAQAAHEKTLPDTHGPCKWCSKTTIKETLANYGARCYECYERYVTESTPPGPLVEKEKYGEHRAWAYALRTRETVGASLSGAQKAMWRAVLGDE